MFEEFLASVRGVFPYRKISDAELEEAKAKVEAIRIATIEDTGAISNSTIKPKEVIETTISTGVPVTVLDSKQKKSTTTAEVMSQQLMNAFTHLDEDGNAIPVV